MTIYSIRDDCVHTLHPEDEKKVITDNCGFMHYVEETEDQDGDHNEVIQCFSTKQEAWQQLLNRAKGFIHDDKERFEWLMDKAVEDGYMPPAESTAAKTAREYARAWTIEYHRLMNGT